MSKIIIALCLLAMIACVSAETTDIQKRDQALCTSYCNTEWPDQTVCAEVCTQSAIGEVSDCNAGDNDSSDEKYAFWSGCSYGLAIGKDSTCGSFCAKLHFTHNLSKFFELGCSHICQAVVNKKVTISCRNKVCGRLWGIEACWRGCAFANGLVHGVEGHEGATSTGN